MAASDRGQRREARSAWLRLAAFFVLLLNLEAATVDEWTWLHSSVVIGYGAASAVAILAVALRRVPRWFPTVYVAIDAVLVLALFHAHVFSAIERLDHRLTAPTLAIGFLLLAQVSLRLRPRLVLAFSAIVVVGWLLVLAAAVTLSLRLGAATSHDWKMLAEEAALATAFGFAAFVSYLLTRDHNAQVRAAIETERRRGRLARFFSPAVVAELQNATAVPALTLRDAAIMFVDLRGFTRLSETARPEDLADLLTEYRTIVSDLIFAHGGTVDKFIGDGVMAVFGFPRPAPDDRRRAMACAVETAQALTIWRQSRARAGRPAPDFGIGIHAGEVFGGVLAGGCHDEFTVFGDAVNVAERLEGMSKPLDAAVVASARVFAALDGPPPAAWRTQFTSLPGRDGTLEIAYLPRQAGPSDSRSPASTTSAAAVQSAEERSEIPRRANQKLVTGTASHCTTGESPISKTGIIGMSGA